jgi:outer membrane protein OmpA-like peptidoglycan-associated protein
MMMRNAISVSEEFMTRQMIAITGLVALMLASGCVATRKFTRNEVKASADQLSARIDTTDANAKELKDRVDRVATQTDTNTKNIASVKDDVQKVDSKTDQVRGETQKAQSTADKAVAETATLTTNVANTDRNVATINRKIDNLNNYSVVAEKTVYFPFNSASPSNGYDEALTEVANLMNQNKGAIIVLEGHTDSTGQDTYNVSLADRRADAVLRHLVVDMNLPMYRIYKMGYGEAHPIAPNDNKSDREKNRCVVIRVLTAQVNG